MRVKPGVILITILMALLPAMIYLSFDFGITCDERLQDARGKSVLHFYYSGLKAADLLPSTRYYGSFVDTTSVLLQRFLGFLKPHETRHVLACIFGWLGIVFTALLARKLFGIEAAFFSVFFLLVSPRYFGHSMNNSKDIPFAALFVASLSFICSFNNRYPFLTPKAVAVTALTIGLAIAVRPAGIILFLAAGLLLFGIIYGRRNTLTKTQVLNTVLWYVALILGAVAIAALFWPTLVIKPLSNVVSALQFNAQFPGQRKELFNRSFTNIAKLPWYYLPVWLGITAPPAVLFSFALSPILLFLNTDRLRIGLLYFSILFPFVVALIARSPLYDEMRHFLFVYPPIVLLASGNLGLLFRKIRKRVVWLAVLLVLTAAGTYHPFLFHLRQHPNQVVYFNQLVGGIQGANGKYELDVWGNCYKQALDWLDMFCKKRGKPGRVTFILPPLKADDTLDSVVKEGKFSSTIPYVAQLRNLIYSPRPEQAEFFVSFLRGSPSYLKAIREWGHTLHETVVEKVPTCTVKKLYEDY